MPRVIVVGGTEPVADDYLRSVYLRVIDVAQDEGYSVFIKDHPVHRLNVDCASCVNMDPAVPLELVDTEFAFAIGVASTGLLAIGERKISIVNALASMPEGVKQMRVKHLTSLPDGDRIEFVSSLDDVQRILRESQVGRRACPLR